MQDCGITNCESTQESIKRPLDACKSVHESFASGPNSKQRKDPHKIQNQSSPNLCCTVRANLRELCFYYERRIRTDVVVNNSNHKHITTTTNLWMMSPRLHLRQLLGNSKTRMAIILVRNRRTTTRATSKVVNHPIIAAAAAAAIMIVVVVASHLSIHGINDHSRG